MNKFAIVGCEASGKTVFMSALCDCFRTAIVPENAAANRFARFASRQLRTLRQWPPATPPGRAVEMNFTLRENGRALAELGLLEFGGETFRAAFRDDESEPAHKQAVKDLLAFLGDADFILVLVSLKELLRDPGETPLEEFERDTESIWVTRGLLEFIKKKAPTANVLIGLTQADRFARELSAAESPDRLFAARWPSIRAVAPDVPVVGIASVSGTDAEERPVEGFTTDGILPVLREFARQQFGAPTDLLLTLTSVGKSLESAFSDPKLASARLSEITRLTKRYGATINALKAVSTLTKDPISDGLPSAEEKRVVFERNLKELRAKAPKRKTSRRTAKQRPLVRRVFLLALLLASTVFLADTYWPYKPHHVDAVSSPRQTKDATSSSDAERTPRLQPSEPTGDSPETRNSQPETRNPEPETRNQKPEIRNPEPEIRNPEPETRNSQPETRKPEPETRNPETETRNPEPETRNPEPETRNSQPETRNSQPATRNPEPETRNQKPETRNSEPPFRIWHDHNGKSIEARWLDTAKDQKSITLETRSGKRIRAVLYKLSEEDRTFVVNNCKNTQKSQSDVGTVPTTTGDCPQ